jgi:hypothetical protein
VQDTLAFAADHGAGLIKGRATERFYPQPGLRHVGDIDLHVAHWPDAADLLLGLRDRGWDWDEREVPWLKWDSQHPYGQWALVVRRGQQPILRLDLHIGPYSVGYCGLIGPLGFEPVGDAYPVAQATAATSLVLLAAHAAGDGLLTVKDVNDYACIVAAAHVDWDDVVAAATGACVTDVLGQLGAWASRVYGTAGPVPGRLDHPLPLAPPSRGQRARYIAALAFRQHPGRMPARARVAAQAWHYYRRDLGFDQGRRMAAPTRPELRDRCRCWRFAPKQVWDLLPAAGAGQVTLPGAGARGRPLRPLRLADRLLLTTAGDSAVVRLGDDIFIPTIDGSLTASSVALARRQDGR